MADIFLSVIIPTFGRSADLVGLLRSLTPGQEGREVVVIDDCSPDPSQFDGLKQDFPAVRFVHLDQNGGPGRARNLGALEAAGEVCLFLDSDTELLAGGLDEVERFFRENPNRNMVAGWDAAVPLNAGFFPRFKALSMVVGAPAVDAEVPFLPGRCFAVRRQVMIDSGGFDTTYKGADVEDFELGYRLRKSYGPITYLTKLRVHHRYPDLMKQFRLYWRRVRMWMDLRATAGAFDAGFGMSGNDALIQLLSGLWPWAFLLLLPFGWWLPGVAVLAAAIYANRRFLGLCQREEGLLFTAKAIMCQSFLAQAILAGAGSVVLTKPSVLVHFGGGKIVRLARRLVRLADHGRVYLRTLLSDGPTYLIFFVTGRCNLRCAHCFYIEEIEHADKSRELTLAEIESIARKAPALYHITFTGGETFLRDDIADIVEMFYRHASTRSVTLTTNGTVPELIARAVERIAIACPNMVVRVPLSVDGTEPVHDKSRGMQGAWKKAMRTYEMLRQVADRHDNVKLDLTSVLTQLNGDDIEKLAEYVKANMKVDNHAINLARGAIRDPESIRPAEGIYERIIERTRGDRTRSKYRFPLLSRILIAMRNMTEQTIQWVQANGRMPFVCEAGTRLIEMNEYGELFPCEILDTLIANGETLAPAPFEKSWMGNVRAHEYDLRAVLASDQAKAVSRFIRDGGCACTFECAIGASLVFRPVNIFKSLMLYGKK
ncbi:MAG: hypothetical protein FD176_317 [Rhodospirillaceae bacterium]|nr:MAG: hypothetical protein FD176_317 [Rhodospirillaceae bacterium]TNC97434.1 MAG: hypothetical protein FD119_1034 [Stygiobacter sp.]